EVIPAALAVLRATGLPLELREGEAGWDCFQRQGAALPDQTLAAAREADAVLFGAVASPSHPVPGYRSPIVALRRALDLYANIRPTTSAEHAVSGAPAAALAGRGAAVDLVVVRENTECLYIGQEQSDGETATATRLITRRTSERIARFAFELASQRVSQAGSGRPRVTIVHKANVLRETCGLFRTAALRVAESYPQVAADELLVDTAALQLVQRPERFDVLVTTNMFGDILSDVASYWSGGLGLASSANIGDRHALFEPVHGAAPDIAGKGIANPLAAIGCVAMLLDHLAQTRSGAGSDFAGWAGRVRAAVRATLRGETRTPDLGGRASTEDVTRAVIDSL
ncbi:MAG TPA: isocitrate/isopropylmalate dehydrogenase family protein, partial [Roseiflexaceae bacterium]|nr:isocitrate/isopropylmalate dehydrogenase family protein [Roseiflexaceae bacterium]